MRVVRCPTCGREVEWATGAFRPFCSERCQLLDFGKWAREEFRIPGEVIPPTAESDDADDES